MLTQLKIALTALVLYGAAAPAMGAELVMVDMRSCIYCEKFRDEVEPTYSATQAGRLAPLRKVSLYKRWPKDLAGIRPAHFTPVFIVIDDGREIGRFAGFTSPQAFYDELDPILAKVR